jgi:hypothetical protein
VGWCMGHGPSTVTSEGLAAAQKQASKQSTVLGAQQDMHASKGWT